MQLTSGLMVPLWSQESRISFGLSWRTTRLEMFGFRPRTSHWSIWINLDGLASPSLLLRSSDLERESRPSELQILQITQAGLEVRTQFMMTEKEVRMSMEITPSCLPSSTQTSSWESSLTMAMQRCLRSSKERPPLRSTSSPQEEFSTTICSTATRQKMSLRSITK